MIQAIETRYKGYRFRSRLEARWAVFFDAMGIEWAYEHEGYKLPSGLYLPDFWLPQVKMFAEVKPEMPTPHEWQLCRELCVASGHSVMVLDGMPSTKNYWGWRVSEYYGPNEYVDDWVICEGHRYWESERRFFAVTGESYPNRICLEEPHWWPAIELARGARFEHGETPQIHVEPKHPAPQSPTVDKLHEAAARLIGNSNIPNYFSDLPDSQNPYLPPWLKPSK